MTYKLDTPPSNQNWLYIAFAYISTIQEQKAELQSFTTRIIPCKIEPWQLHTDLVYQFVISSHLIAVDRHSRVSKAEFLLYKNVCARVQAHNADFLLLDKNKALVKT